MFAAAEVRAAGWGGLAVVSQITGLARSTINRGEDDLDGEPLVKGRVRRPGGGRWLRRTLGDPVRPLLWVSKSMDKLARSLGTVRNSV